MRVLVVGGAGYVASIIRPALEAKHRCRYFDRVPVPGRAGRTMVGDVLDEKRVARAVRDMDAIVYLALGASTDAPTRGGYRMDVDQIPSAFAVNTAAFYGFAAAGLEAGVRKLIYASTYNVFSHEKRHERITDMQPTDAWDTYGLSKRCGELVCEAAGQHCPRATVISLRLWAPRNEEHFRQPLKRFRPGMVDARLGPADTSALFLAALACKRPGVHLLNTSGDVTGKRHTLTRARRVLGWSPKGH